MRDVVVASFHPFILYMYSVAGNVGDDVKFIDPLNRKWYFNIKNIKLYSVSAMR